MCADGQVRPFISWVLVPPADDRIAFGNDGTAHIYPVHPSLLIWLQLYFYCDYEVYINPFLMALSIHSQPHSNADPHAEGHYTHLPTNVDNSSPEGVPNPNSFPSIQDRGIRVTLEEGAQMRPQGINSPYHDALLIEESIEARLERLGRQRNMVFGSIWSEVGFVFSISMSQVLTV